MKGCLKWDVATAAVWSMNTNQQLFDTTVLEPVLTQNRCARVFQSATVPEDGGLKPGSLLYMADRQLHLSVNSFLLRVMGT